MQMINAFLITWLRRCFQPLSGSRACEIFSPTLQLWTPKLLLTDATWTSFCVYCASSSFVFPKDSLQKSPSFLYHLFYLLFFIHNSQFSLFLIIPSKSDSQSTHFCFSETKISTVTKQVYGSRFYPILEYFESEERLSQFRKITGTGMKDSNLV